MNQRRNIMNVEKVSKNTDVNFTVISIDFSQNFENDLDNHSIEIAVKVRLQIGS